MAKNKTKGGVPNKHLRARLSYLQQAAIYLTARNAHHPDSGRCCDATGHPSNRAVERDYAVKRDDDLSPGSSLNFPATGGLPLYLNSHLRQVALKSQIRLHTDVKHAFCKACNTALVEGQTCRRYIENLSKGGKKPHADVSVLQCNACGAAKRFPIGAKRQKRKGERQPCLPSAEEPLPAQSRAPCRI
ncbi:hypothetical protein BAUCODRAFT_553501 [Baudoinia panamericana UAMH 10762]|uniref:RNAse P Rpr2/Rpp21 subunit domain-containing protein n=1 Tax=Baudoinia panamericana (strain UAMH 10762) TaxID=717646 RepID=M2N733_BAUPA|nr:uncharacterized protein BAUCODRAFT_553501 [Baudoinia panamericana UAMH 10762]EMC94590.1 hypothetical protein BAUCODRAFT_553501 [Baudoinia panamericana UAMH 10762]